jgi:glycerol kinase
VLLVGHDGAIRGRGYREISQHYPQPGWVEQDAEEIWQTTLAVIAEALASAPDCRPIAVGVTNQRETMLFWDRQTGRPCHPAVVWQCRRSASICEELRGAGLEPEIARKTGLRLDPYFSGTKALWLLHQDASLRARIATNEVRFGTIDSWLLYRLSGGRVHATDVTNASRTLAFDIERFDWDEPLLALFGLNRGVMPVVHPSSHVYGETVSAGALPGGLPIAALVGDQQAALFGQGCLEAGMIKATYGTGCFILMHSGDQPVRSSGGLLTTVAATTAPGQRRYALEGSIFIAGAAMQWCRDNLGIIASAEEGEQLARSVEDSGGVVFVPAFVGLGSPHWGPDVRGAIFGLTGATTKAQIVRAALESIVFQAQDVLEAMATSTAAPSTALRVDGGAAANDLLMQMQADLNDTPVSRPQTVESTAMGAAYLAGLATGFWKDEGEVCALRREEMGFVPRPEAREAALLAYSRWTAAVQGLLGTELRPR